MPLALKIWAFTTASVLYCSAHGHLPTHTSSSSFGCGAGDYKLSPSTANEAIAPEFRSLYASPQPLTPPTHIYPYHLLIWFMRFPIIEVVRMT